MHKQIGRKTPVAATAEEEDQELVARFRNRPSTEWLSEHDVEQAFKAIAGQHSNGGSAGVSSDSGSGAALGLKESKL